MSTLREVSGLQGSALHSATTNMQVTRCGAVGAECTELATLQHRSPKQPFLTHHAAPDRGLPIPPHVLHRCLVAKVPSLEVVCEHLRADMSFAWIPVRTCVCAASRRAHARLLPRCLVCARREISWRNGFDKRQWFAISYFIEDALRTRMEFQKQSRCVVMRWAFL